MKTDKKMAENERDTTESNMIHIKNKKRSLKLQKEEKEKQIKLL